MQGMSAIRADIFTNELKNTRDRPLVIDHLKGQHDVAPDDTAQFFKILKKCQSKFDCLIFEFFFFFFIKELKPTLNKQCDSIRAKLFV